MNETLLILVRGLITILVLIPVSAALLFASTKIFKIKSKLKIAFVIALISDVIGFLLDSFNRISITQSLPDLFNFVDLAIGVILAALTFFLIKIMYKTDWGKTALIWLVWFVLYFIAGTIINFILVIIFALTGLL